MKVTAYSRAISHLAALLLASAPIRIEAAERPQLQVFNGTEKPAEMFWLKTPTERVSNGAIEPGANRIVSTTIGHRFVIVGVQGEAAIESLQPVQASYYGGVPAVYTQRIEAHGFPIVASAGVNSYALKEAAFLVDLLLARRPDVRNAIVQSGARLCIMAHNQFTTALPEFARFAREPHPRFPQLTGTEYWDARARGTGGSRTDPFCTCAEENVLGYPGDPFATECILIHEFAHCIHLRGMVNVDPTFDTRLKAAYDRAMKAGLWKAAYASTNHHEYFAEGVQSWFDNNRANDNEHNDINTRAKLDAYDPGLAALCREVFGDTEIKYTKPATRLTGHLAGYDPAQAPAFHWPERLSRAKREIAESVKARNAAATVPAVSD